MQKQKWFPKVPKLNKVWQRMISRCYDPQSQKFKFYGGIGVKVCDEWMNYQNFLDWALSSGWQEGLQIDKDIKGDGKLYSPETCCWVTPQVNQRARKHLIKVAFEGEEILLVELCERFKIQCRIVKQRMNRDGMTLVQALTIPNSGQGNFINRKKMMV